MLKDIKKKFTTKGVLAFILVVALLIIVADQNNKKSALQAEVDALQGRVVEADGERIKAEIERARVINQLEAVGLELDANITALNDALENPNCPAATQ